MIQNTNIGTQKIDGTTLKTHGIVISTLSMSDKNGRERFLEKSFLLADVKPDIIFEILFLIMSNIDVDFQARNL